MSEHNTWTIPEPKADYIVLSEEEYNRRLGELEELRAELARLRELVQWQPVEDGVYETQHDGDQVEVSGEWLTVREKDILDPTDSFIADAALPDNLRLCRRNPDAQPQPASVPDNEVLDWLKRLVLAKENEMLCYIQRYNYEENSTQLATCRAALAWLDAQSQTTSVPKQAKSRTGAEILADFYNKVCDRAERNMAHTGTISGAHWNAMKQVLAEMGVEVTR